MQIREARRTGGTLLVALAALALLACALAPAARAETVEFGSGQLDWGVKQSFRTYIKGGGLIETFGGASEVDGTIRFPVHAGGYDDVSGSGSVAAGGSVRFTAHGGALDMTISNPVLELDGDGGLLRAFVGSKKNAGGVICEEIELAAYDLAGTPPQLGPPFELNTALGDLTAAGVSVFDPFYAVGEDMDAVSLAATVGTPSPAPTPPPCPTEDPDDPGDPTDPGNPTDPGTPDPTSGGGGSTPTTSTSTPQTQSQKTAHKPKPKRCKKGFRKAKVKGKPGKTRCVKKKKRQGKNAKRKAAKRKAAKRRAAKRS